MIDTPPQIEQAFREMLLQRSGEERLKMGCSMHGMVQALVRAGVLEKDPSASPAAIRRALLIRFYGLEIAPETMRKILSALEGMENSEPA